MTDKFVSSLAAGGGTGNTPVSPYTMTEAHANFTTGLKMNVKADGTYARTTTNDNAAGLGTSTTPGIWSGYLNTPGDGYLGRTAGGDLITTNMPVITYTTGSCTLSSYSVMENINISTSAGSAATVALEGPCTILRSRISNSSTNVNSLCLLGATAVAPLIYDCDIYQLAATGVAPAIRGMNNGTKIYRCRIRSISGPGINVQVNGVYIHIIGNAIFKCGTQGITVSGAPAGMLISNNTIVGNTGDGIDIITQGVNMAILENMITDNGGYGIDLQNVASATSLGYNRMRDNSLGNINLGTDWVAALNHGLVTTDTGGPETDYVDYTNNDFRLISASPGARAGIQPYSSIGAHQVDSWSGLWAASGQRLP